MSRVVIFIRTHFPSMNSRFVCAFCMNRRLFLGALRSHRPECWWRMCRPKPGLMGVGVNFFAAIMLNFRSVRGHKPIQLAPRVEYSHLSP